jgi:hypothetical protein
MEYKVQYSRKIINYIEEDPLLFPRRIAVIYPKFSVHEGFIFPSGHN